MRVSVKLLMISSALAVTALACGGGGGDEAAPTGTVLAASATSTESAPADAGCTPEVHVVQMGDTLSAIALEFDVSAEAIADASDLSDLNMLAIDQELTIPCPVPEVAPPEATSPPAA